PAAPWLSAPHPWVRPAYGPGVTRGLPPRQRGHDVHQVADADLIARLWIGVDALQPYPRGMNLVRRVVVRILQIVEARAVNIDQTDRAQRRVFCAGHDHSQTSLQ